MASGAPVQMPVFLREVLYAPPCPEPAAAQFEVALAQQNSGAYGAAVNAYLAGLAAWEDALLHEQFEAQGIVDVETRHAKKLRRAAAAAAEEEAEAADRRAEDEARRRMQRVARKRAAAEAAGETFQEEDMGSEETEEPDSEDPAARSGSRRPPAPTRKGKKGKAAGDEDPEVARRAAARKAAAEALKAEQAERAEQQRQREQLRVAKAGLVEPVGRIFVHLAVASAFESVGGAEDEKALAELHRALDLCRLLPGTQVNMVTATVYSALGAAYAHLSQFDLAADYMFRALEIREGNDLARHVDVGLLLNNIGGVLFALGRRTDALVLLGRAEAIFADQLPAAHPRREVAALNAAMARGEHLADAVFPAVGFTPYTPPMVPGAVAAMKFRAPKPKKKPGGKDDKRR